MSNERTLDTKDKNKNNSRSLKVAFIKTYAWDFAEEYAKIVSKNI